MNNDDIHALESIDQLQFYNSMCLRKYYVTTLNNVLDFGCGYGTLISYVKKYNKEILGYDINENARAVLKEKNIKYINSLNKSMKVLTQ